MWTMGTKRTRKIWSEEEIEYMKEHYPHIQSAKVAEALGRNLRSVYAYAKIMQIKKTAEFMKSPEAGGFQKGKTYGYEYRFQKGYSPPNKGKKQTEYMSPEGIEKTLATRFKKGQTPINTMKDGDITFRKRKKRNTQGFFYRLAKGKWIPLAQKIWMDNFGPIPKGGVIRLKDGNPLNCEPENLELITQRENMLKNSISMYPAELIPIVKMNIKLKRQIKEHENN